MLSGCTIANGWLMLAGRIIAFGWLLLAGRTIVFSWFMLLCKPQALVLLLVDHIVAFRLFTLLRKTTGFGWFILVGHTTIFWIWLNLLGWQKYGEIFSWKWPVGFSPFKNFRLNLSHVDLDGQLIAHLCLWLTLAFHSWPFLVCLHQTDAPCLFR